MGDPKQTVYSEASASDANVDFPIEQALPAAQAAWNLAQAIEASSARLTTGVNGVPSWVGPHRDAFDSKVAVYKQSATNYSNTLYQFATNIGLAWSMARGQQNRVNFARYVEHEIGDDSAAENFGEFFTGEDDYGAPPENPPAATGGGFASTGDAMHTEFGP